MKVTLSSIKTLKPFAKWNDHFVVIPPRRLVVFGEGKEGALRGIAVEGYLNETLDAPMAYSFLELLTGTFARTGLGFEPMNVMPMDDMFWFAFRQGGEPWRILI